MFRLVIIFFLGLYLNVATADVVKPALIEISVYRTGEVSIEMRASIEALLTGINARYRNTTESPAASDYDGLRSLDPLALGEAFTPFQQTLLQQIYLEADGEKVPLEVDSVTIPEPGYTKVPRISVILLRGNIERQTKSLRWYYPARFGDNAVRVQQVDKENDQWHWSQWQWLRKDEPSTPFSLDAVFARVSRLETIGSYISVGFEHIVPKGTDHILFILGLFLFSVRMRPLLWQVTMFTIAHTLTLGLSMNGVISLPSNIVEPLIALSIAYVGIENVFAKSLHKSRLLLVFMFGLLHGLGFAGVLSDFGMPDDDFATALISFNVGVELGQLSIITLAFLAFGYWYGKTPWYRKRIVVPASSLISVCGLIWMVERIQF